MWIKYLWFLRLLTQINLPFHLSFCERKTAYYFRSLRCQACVSCRCKISFFFVSLTLKVSIAAFLCYLYIWINHTVSRSCVINLFPGQSPKKFCLLHFVCVVVFFFRELSGCQAKAVPSPTPLKVFLPVLALWPCSGHVSPFLIKFRLGIF